MTVETCTIYPTNKHNRPSLPPAIALHGLDLLSAPLQIRNNRFFHPPPTGFSDVVDKLKSSLAEALELYPPAAATVKVDEEGVPYIALDADSMQGSPFLVEVKDTPYAGDTEDLCPRSEVVLPPNSSTLAVKVTQFSCGTIAVSSSLNHQVADLRGFLDFLELWAQLARGEAVDFTKIPSDWTRTPSRFFEPVGKSSVSAPPPFQVIPTPATGGPASLSAPSGVSRWRLTKNSMERLKGDFSPSASKDLWISSGDALAALICGAITRARETVNVTRLEGRSTLESRIESVAMAADGRERSLQGKMTNGQYFGNFNLLLATPVSRSDLLSPTCEAASRVALAFRNALGLHLSQEAIGNKLGFFEDPQNNKPPGRIVWTADLILTNWCRFDLQGPKLDFGWGKPFCATSGAGGTLPPGYSVMMQGDSGDIIVLMTVEQDGADALKADSLMNQYATLLPDHTP